VSALALIGLVVLAVIGVIGLRLIGPSGGAEVRGGTATAARSTSRRPPSATGTSTRVESRDPETGLRLVDLTALPAEARRTVALIDAGGPFPYAKDGVAFGNRERLLPIKPAGYYHEYTVPTPAEGDRGARRVVTGDGHRQFFYTGDHYLSFVRIRR
jgi:ribonuclease T1